MNESIKQRIDYELEAIDRMGFNGYFLIVKDIIDNARKQKGSCRNWVVVQVPWKYCGLTYFDITQIDPLKYGLVFGKISKSRWISMPI